LAVTDDDVIWCYRALLGRSPESQDAVRVLVGSAQDFRSLVLLFLRSPEYQVKNLRSALVPLAEGEMHVEVAASKAEMLRLQERIRETWTHLGEARPHHSVLTTDEFLAESINDRSIDRFYQSGDIEAAAIDAMLRRHGFSNAKASTCVEYGCGLGRVTLSLARRFERVHAYDISSNHIALARQRASDLAVRNVQFHLCVDVGDQELEACDFFFSCIVFQHNPPPIIRAMISSSLRSLREGGMAIFQVPTFKAGYVFRLQDYLAIPQQFDIEMHCIPQQAVFALIAEASCRVLEVREDDRIGNHGEWISNTFIVRRE
jgi:SAM-dependent methyltransferase